MQCRRVPNKGTRSISKESVSYVCIMHATSMNSFLPVLDLTPLLPSHLCKRVSNNAGHSGLSLVCRVDVNPHPHLPQGHALPHRGSDIDQRISADTTGAPTIFLEDSCLQAILKHRPCSSFRPMYLIYFLASSVQSRFFVCFLKTVF